ncbi:hypothetical protein MMC20_002451 [Loxospora ochrophaea]|nr:hypothetical protein [Loxospora ochrophaea]
MSAQYQGQDPRVLAQRAERDLNSQAAKQGHDASLMSQFGHSSTTLNRVEPSDSTLESGVDESVTRRFPGSTATTGSAASGAGDNREIPMEEGGDIGYTGRPTRARDFETEGAPMGKAQTTPQQTAPRSTNPAAQELPDAHTLHKIKMEEERKAFMSGQNPSWSIGY